ncbi:hypothetical protein Pcinc_026421 [Petrolisthes cinctipes]|uniref:Uncharacterized protein n=1 Tax=Petrolisthes cinctipes TaxID=88211 RepID=A0AAE1K849_PETCI|nr:hypothetical protein Pcinc_026421 [Petrolisthes cinctipes]
MRRHSPSSLSYLSSSSSGDSPSPVRKSRKGKQATRRSAGRKDLRRIMADILPSLIPSFLPAPAQVPREPLVPEDAYRRLSSVLTDPPPSEPAVLSVQVLGEPHGP